MCLCIATIAGPGERKSAVQQAMIWPILAEEARLVEQGGRASRATRRSVAAKAADRQRRIAAMADEENRDQARSEMTPGPASRRHLVMEWSGA